MRGAVTEILHKVHNDDKKKDDTTKKPPPVVETVFGLSMINDAARRLLQTTLPYLHPGKRNQRVDNNTSSQSGGKKAFAVSC